MNKLEMIKEIADKTRLETEIVKQVMDACEEVLAEAMSQK